MNGLEDKSDSYIFFIYFLVDRWFNFISLSHKDTLSNDT